MCYGAAVGKDIKIVACKNIIENTYENNNKNPRVKFKSVNETSGKKMTYAGIVKAGNINKKKDNSLADLIKVK